MPSVKTNIILNIANTVFGLLFPLITFPYVSRILMPEGIGIVQFYQSIINYIILLSALGIPLYAVRELSRYKDNVKERNKATVEILSLHALLSAAGYLIVFILISFVAKIQSDWPLFLLLSLSIFFNVIGVPWFYQAVEDFKYITIRSLAVRFLSAVALFVCVRTRNDLYVYAVILVCGEVGNYIFNFIRLQKYSVFRDIIPTELSIRRHLRPAFRIFMLNIAISLYVNINPVMLGFMTDDTYVGYYTSVTKILRVNNGIITAIGGAMLPRLSNYFAVGKQNEYELLKNKALDMVTLLCLPISVCLIVVAPNLIPLFSGNAYLPAVETLQISAPTIVVSALNYMIAIQILYTQNREKIVIIATLSGGIVNIAVNWWLIPYFQQNGTAISGLLAELTVLLLCFIMGRHSIKYNIINKNNIEALTTALLCGFGCFAIGFLKTSAILSLFFQITIALFVYILSLIILKNKLFMDYSRTLITNIRKYITPNA